MLSIIIPAYNEEKFLPSILKSIKNQKLRNYEIIVSDNNSIDETKKIAQEFKCKLVKGGTPSKGRNNGAKTAKYPYLLFLDADVILPDDFLSDFLERVKKDKLDFATCLVKPLSKNSDHLFYYMLKNYGNYFFGKIIPHVSGQCFFIRKEAFIKVKGYDESLYLGEEHELAQRLSKKGKGKFYMDIFVYNYPRRLEKDGTYITLLKDTFSEIYRLFKGKLKHKLYERRYGHY